MLWQNLRVPPHCGDQQVPDSSFAVVTGDSGATVTELSQQTLADVTSTLTSAQHALAPRKSVPDLDAILSELSCSPDCNATFMSNVTDIDDMSYWDMDARDQFVRYEDCAERVNVKEEPKCFMMNPEPISPNTAYSDKVLERIAGARALLDLPSNLYAWSAEHTHSWARWTLEQYNLPAMHADNFYLDGTSLCMLSKIDVVCRSAAAGEYLYAELDIWKYASNLRMMSDNVCDQEMTTFVDMKPVNTSMACGVDVLPPLTSTGDFGNSGPTSAYCFLEDLGFNSETSQSDNAYCDSPAGSASVDDLDYMTSSLTSSTSSSSAAAKKMAWSSSPSSSFDSISSSDSEACTAAMDYADFPGSHKFQGSSRHAIHLWQFLKELLLQPQSYQSCIRWLDRNKGVFKIEDSVRVARLWGARKNRPAMNYDKLSRSIRQYYKKGIIKKTTSSKRLVYQFCAPYV